MKKIIFTLITFILFLTQTCALTTEEQLNNISSQIKDAKTKLNNLNLLNDKYPVGSIYITITGTNPSSTLGGTWTAYGQGRTLIGMGSNGTTNYTTLNDAKGSSTTTLAAANLPSHRHSITAKGSVTNAKFTGSSVTVSAGNHTHTLYVQPSGNATSGYGVNGASGFANRIIISQTGYASSTSSAGGHSHTVTPTGTIKSTFTGTNASTANTGSTSAFRTQNPYITVYFWKRTA